MPEILTISAGIAVGSGLFYLLFRRINKRTIYHQRRFQNIFDTRAIGFLIGDRNGQILKANDYFLSLLQYSAEDLQNGLNWRQITPPEHIEVSLNALQVVTARGFSDPFEKEYIRKDGSRIWALVGATAIGDGEIVTYVLDITERRRTRQDLEEIKNRLEENVVQRTKELLDANRELYRLVTESETATERLRESQNFLDSVIENIPNMIFVKDADTLSFVQLNRAGEILIGRDRNELLGKNDFDFFPKEQAEFFTEKDRAVLRDRSVLDISEEPIQTPTGQRILHTKKIPICDKFGRPIYLLGISEDVTDRIQIEEQKTELLDAKAARMAAERTADKLQFLSEATAALNTSLDVNSLLKAFAQSIVRNMADWCIVDFYDEKTSTIERMVAAAADGEVPSEARTWWEKNALNLDSAEGVGYVLRTGEARIYRDLDKETVESVFTTEIAHKLIAWGIHSSIVAPLSYHGKVFGTLSFVLTSDRSYNDFDLSIAQDLARRASLAIQNARLYAQAFEASRAKSAFLANISHEIRTPLGAMLGFAELVLEDRNLSSTQKDYVSTIARNGRQLLRIVDEVLDLSKVESDKIQLERVGFSLRELLNDVRELLLVKTDAKGLSLRFEGIEELPESAFSDPLRIRQILINVIGNAIKFTENGNVQVLSRFIPAQDRKNGGRLEVTVTDTGVGMNEDHTARLFQAFVQADESMTRKYGGTGLGLFLSRKLARLLGGDVTLKKSALGLGSEFLIVIELNLPQAARTPHLRLSPNTKEASPTGVATNQGESPRKVLVVDDSPDNRMLIGAMLGKSGLHLEMVDNGCTAIERALLTGYDLIFMDIQMPGMDGFQTLKTLKDRGYAKPVVALTAHAMKGDRERCMEAGFSDYVCKPVTRLSLLSCLERNVQGLRLIQPAHKAT